MTRIVAAGLGLVAMLALVACEADEPEFTTQDQVPAELREDDVEEPGGEEPGGEEPAEPAGDASTFVAADIDFVEAPSEVGAGTVTFELVNEDGIVHDVTIEELGDEVVVEADAGQTATGTVTLDPGTYTYYCSVPGHRAAGMEGEITAG